MRKANLSLQNYLSIRFCILLHTVGAQVGHVHEEMLSRELGFSMQNMSKETETYIQRCDFIDVWERVGPSLCQAHGDTSDGQDTSIFHLE